MHLCINAHVMNFDRLICLHNQHSIKIANITIAADVPSCLYSVSPYPSGNHFSDFECHRLGFVVQSLSCVWLLATPWTAACQPSMSFTISWSLLKFMSIESMMLANHHILCYPILLLPLIFPRIRVFSSLHIRWPKY